MIGSGSDAFANFSERHREVLDAAMALIAERGVDAASLRELARRLQMSQPSLYHYFASKDELIEQIVTFHVGRAMSLAMDPVTLASVCRELRPLMGMMANQMLRVWESPEHVTFAQFLFACARTRPELGQVFHNRMVRSGKAVWHALVRPLVDSGELCEDDPEYLFQLVTGSLLAQLLQRHVLKIEAEIDLPGFAEYVVDVAIRGVQARAVARADQEDP